MSIGNVSNNFNTFPSVSHAASAVSGGRMSVPVAPSQVIYSYFKHVSGTPAPEGTTGVNISRLQILNTLIDQLDKMKGQGGTGQAPMVDTGTIGGLDEKRVNALIEQYHQQIKAAQSISPYTPASPATGSLFNIAA